jgi:hypothetical protein
MLSKPRKNLPQFPPKPFDARRTVRPAAHLSMIALVEPPMIAVMSHVKVLKKEYC